MGGPRLHNFQVAGYQAGLANSALDAAKAGVTAATQDNQNADHEVALANQVKDDVSAVTSVLEHAASKFGDKVARIAQDLAAEARTAKIRIVPLCLINIKAY